MTLRLTVAQALVRYLAALRVDDGRGPEPLFGGVFAIFGHGNVAGLGEALHAVRAELPTYRAHSEQGMAHAAIAYAKTHFRRRMMACTTSIGRGGHQPRDRRGAGAREPVAGAVAIRARRRSSTSSAPAASFATCSSMTSTSFAGSSTTKRSASTQPAVA